ncbi:MAG TPA: hypothetical protein VEA36_02055 [Candidatus Paceibacterota bacterium]|nr:hypothetical protein [Candidatus Paceibacterota bacterium]
MKMTFSSLENSILMEVIHTPRSVAELYQKYVERSRCSRAGFYKAVASLKKKEVVVEEGRLLSVNKIWLADSYDFFRKLVRQKTTPSYLAQEVSRLNKGDRLSYTFHSIAEIDIFVLNLLYDLLLLKIDTKALILEAHEFFVLLNDSRTRRIMGELANIGGRVHVLIEGGTALDKEVVRRFLPKPAEGHVVDTKSASSSNILHVIGDVCIELKLNKQLAVSLNHLFAANEKMTDGFRTDLENLLSKKRKHEVVIYRDSSKASRLRGRFKKYF